MKRFRSHLIGGLLIFAVGLSIGIFTQSDLAAGPGMSGFTRLIFGEDIFIRRSNHTRLIVLSESATADATMIEVRTGAAPGTAQFTVDEDGDVVSNIITAGTPGNIGTQSTDHGASAWAGAGFIETPWVYANAIEATGERGASGTNIQIGAATDTANDQIALVTNGTPRLFVDSNSFIGIGSTTPGDLLDINTTATTSGIELDNRDALTGYDGDTWLRLNQSSQWSSGVYTPSHLRADGEIRQGSGDAGAYEIQTGGQLYVADYVVALGGIHVGGTSDPGTDHMIVDGNIGINGGNTSTAFVHIVDGGVAAGTEFIRVGDDSFITDIDAVNSVSIRGVQNNATATLQLGSAGAQITGTTGGHLDVNSKRIESLGTPSSSTDAATKAYVDSVAGAGTGTDFIRELELVDFSDETYVVAVASSTSSLSPGTDSYYSPSMGNFGAAVRDYQTVTVSDLASPIVTAFRLYCQSTGTQTWQAVIADTALNIIATSSNTQTDAATGYKTWNFSDANLSAYGTVYFGIKSTINPTGNVYMTVRTTASDVYAGGSYISGSGADLYGFLVTARTQSGVFKTIAPPSGVTAHYIYPNISLSAVQSYDRVSCLLDVSNGTVAVKIINADSGATVAGFTNILTMGANSDGRNVDISGITSSVRIGFEVDWSSGSGVLDQIYLRYEP